MENSNWEKKIEEGREEKDEFFKNHPESPIPIEDRKSFNGLSYFPINPRFRFVLELKEHFEKRIIQIEDTKGQIRNFLRWGEFVFVIDGKEYKLQVYTNDPVREELFVPFKDLTNGKETYGAGRYLDLYYDRDRTKDGKWILDFNKAYNPWCAYSPRYACPFVPPENWLKVPVKAGEKNYIKGVVR